MEKEKPFHARLLLLTPVAASLAAGFLFASLILVSQSELPSVAFLPDTGFGPFLNAAIFVVLTGIGASMIYFFSKRKERWLIHFLVGFAISIVTFFLSGLYLEMLFSLLNVNDAGLLIFLDAVLITIMVDIELFMLHNVGYEVTILVLGGALGTFLGASIPTFSAVLILLFLAAYDIFAVFRGPVGKIAVEGLEDLHGLSFSFKDIQMGLGDLTFYSMLVNHALIFFGFWPCLGGIIGVLVGSFFSFKMLEKKGMFPGLPFSILLGLLGILVMAIIP